MNGPMVLTLARCAALSAADQKILAAAVTSTRDLRRDQDLIREGEQPTECHIILDGVLCRYKLLPEGRRQIVGIQVPGDLCDLSGLVMGHMDHSVGTLTAAKVAVIPHAPLRTIMDEHPAIAAALWQEIASDASIAREWVANVGRRTAYQRVAHLLCEVGSRLQAAGHASDGSFEWPLTQQEVADATGVTTIHVNRMFRQLREDRLIAMQGSTIRVPDWARLRHAGEFNPDYLFLSPREQERPSATAS
jgi:CRP-like cAMP-binding protein